MPSTEIEAIDLAIRQVKKALVHRVDGFEVGRIGDRQVYLSISVGGYPSRSYVLDLDASARLEDALLSQRELIDNCDQHLVQVSSRMITREI